MRTTKHLEWDIMVGLIEKMKEDGNRLHLLVTMQGLLGLRVGDALKLTWKQLLGDSFIITEEKTGKQRKMMVSETLREAVSMEYKRKYGRARITDKIFINRHKTTHMSVSYVNKNLKKTFAKFGIDADQVSSHMFRKSFAYKIMSDGEFSDKSIYLVSRLLNHSNISTTMKYLLLHEKEESEVYNSLKL